MYIRGTVKYTIIEYQEQADHCGQIPTETEIHAVAKLMREAAQGKDTTRLAAQIAIAFPAERIRAKAREARTRAGAAK